MIRSPGICRSSAVAKDRDDMQLSESLPPRHGYPLRSGPSPLTAKHLHHSRTCVHLHVPRRRHRPYSRARACLVRHLSPQCFTERRKHNETSAFRIKSGMVEDVVEAEPLLRGLRSTSVTVPVSNKAPAFGKWRTPSFGLSGKRLHQNSTAFRPSCVKPHTGASFRFDDARKLCARAHIHPHFVD